MRKELVVAVAAIAGAILAAYLFARRAEVATRLSPAGPFPGPIGGPSPQVIDINGQTGRLGEVCSGIAGGQFDPPGCPGAPN